MNEKYKLISEILKKGEFGEYESNGWYEYEYKETPIWEKAKEPIMSDLLDMLEKLIEKHPRNIIQILEALPEEEIQKFLRAKKMAKIKSNESK